jgi:hypothetical protein
VPAGCTPSRCLRGGRDPPGGNYQKLLANSQSKTPAPSYVHSMQGMSYRDVLIFLVGCVLPVIVLLSALAQRLIAPAPRR